MKYTTRDTKEAYDHSLSIRGLRITGTLHTTVVCSCFGFAEFGITWFISHHQGLLCRRCRGESYTPWIFCQCGPWINMNLFHMFTTITVQHNVYYIYYRVLWYHRLSCKWTIRNIAIYWMITKKIAHIRSIRNQSLLFKSLWFSHPIWSDGAVSSLNQVRACHLFDTMPLPAKEVTYSELDWSVQT